jgi:DNA polymerase (family 10)
MNAPGGPANAVLADRLDAFALLLDLAEANPYSARAYRRAADLIRATEAPVAQLVRAGRARELRGIGAGIEGRLRELVETGDIAELAELERSLSPELVGVGRYLGIGAKRAIDIGRALGVRTAEELRAAAETGRLHDVPGIGPKTERELRARIEAGAPDRPEGRALLLPRAQALVEAIAAAVGGVPAGDVRRGVDAPRLLTVAAAAERPDRALDAFAAARDVVALLARGGWRARGVTVDGVAVEVVVAPPERFGTALVRSTGSAAYVDALEPLPEGPTEQAVYAALGIPYCPPELREAPFRSEPPALVELADVRGDLHCHTTWSDGKASVAEMGEAARARGYEYLAICDHTRSVGVVPGLDAEDLRRQAEEIAAVNERLAPFRVLRGTECDIHPNGSLDLPDDVLAELDWVMASVHAGQRASRDELTRRVEEAMRNPYVCALSHPTGRLIERRPPNALDLERVFELALETGVAVEVNGLPDRLDLSAEHVRTAVDAGVPILLSSDSHSTVGLARLELAVLTARRGWAAAADVVNTRGLAALLAGRRKS